MGQTDTAERKALPWPPPIIENSAHPGAFIVHVCFPVCPGGWLGNSDVWRKQGSLHQQLGNMPDSVPGMCHDARYTSPKLVSLGRPENGTPLPCPNPFPANHEAAFSAEQAVRGGLLLSSDEGGHGRKRMPGMSYPVSSELYQSGNLPFIEHLGTGMLDPNTV